MLCQCWLKNLRNAKTQYAYATSAMTYPLSIPQMWQEFMIVYVFGKDLALVLWQEFNIVKKQIASFSNI